MSAKVKKAPPTYRYCRIVVKLGTSLLTGGTNHLDRETMSRLADQLARLHKDGLQLVAVTSGAVACGRQELGVTKKLSGIPYKQVLAAVGQHHLMMAYEELLDRHGIVVAQALLTRGDLADRAGYLNTRNTLLALMELGVLCVINENDVVAVDEIQGARFGDNDSLSAMVANLVDADLLLILSDTDGLYTADPHLDPQARLIPTVKKIDAQIEKLATSSATKLGTGGMITKIEAAKLATASGVTMVIANGSLPDVILRVVAGEKLGTTFLPTTPYLESRKRWMLSGLATRGKLMVDSGAALALKEQKCSLLAAGIKEVEGDFERGDIVNIYDTEGNHLGSGISNYSSRDINTIKGAHSGRISSLLGYDYGSEVVHRNNLVVIGKEGQDDH